MMIKFCEFLSNSAERFHKTNEWKEMVARFSDRLIDPSLVMELIEPFIKFSGAENGKYGEELVSLMEPRLKKWAPKALESIHRDSHMNRARGGRTLNQDTADALLVGFANYAAAPADLALHTGHLYRT